MHRSMYSSGIYASALLIGFLTNTRHADTYAHTHEHTHTYENGWSVSTSTPFM